MKPSLKLRTWERTQTAWDVERDRINFLKTAPLPVTPPELLRPIRCKVIKSFCLSGKPIAVGSTVILPYFDAFGLWEVHKIMFLE